MAKESKNSGPAAASGSSKSNKAKTTAVDVASIDDIFAAPAPAPKKRKVDERGSASAPGPSSKTKAKASANVQPSTGEKTKGALSGTSEKRKKKKAAPGPGPEPTAGTQEPTEVEEVLDPSLLEVRKAVEAAKSQSVSASADSKDKAGKKARRSRKDVEEDEMFADSRGEGPRRKTEEGFLIYKEAELQIDPEAGGTPLCPFDCDCCF